MLSGVAQHSDPPTNAFVSSTLLVITKGPFWILVYFITARLTLIARKIVAEVG